MQYFRLLPVAAALGIIVPGVYYPAFAEELHSHKASSTKHDRIRDVAAGSFSSIGQAWLALKSAVEASSGLIAAGNLEPIPAKIEKADAAIKYLQNAGGIWDAHKKARAEAILRQLFDLSGDLHEAVNANDAVKAWQTIKVLEAALKLIEIQYPAEALQVSAGMDASDHGESHQMATAATATTRMSLIPMTPLVVGEEVSVTVKLTKPDGTPMLLSDLEEVHTEKLHLLINDFSLSDYHHEHPVPTAVPGEYGFTFTPLKTGPYRVWADLVPVATNIKEYAIADIAASTRSEPITNRTPSTSVEVDGLKYEIIFKQPILKAGTAVLVLLRITTPDGEVFEQLEPVMGAYAHIVGFSEDLETIAHVHPMGVEPVKPTDRGIGDLAFHLLPSMPGLMRLYAQVRIGGLDKFAPFTLEIQP
jgi:hypothetical protein